MVQFNYFPLVLTFIAHTDANTGQLRMFIMLSDDHVYVLAVLQLSWSPGHSLFFCQWCM